MAALLTPPPPADDKATRKTAKKRNRKAMRLMRAYGPTLIVTIVVVALMAFTRAQGVGIEFGRTSGTGGKPATNFRGRADAVREAGRVKTYSGNVTISFPDAAVVLHADAVVFDPDAHE